MEPHRRDHPADGGDPELGRPVRRAHPRREGAVLIFSETSLAGAFVVEVEPHEDARGSFARTWCQREFGARGLETRLVQCSTSLSHVGGTLRGLHYQVAPAAETKLVRCTRGAVYDVIVDLRPESPTYTKYFATILSADNKRMVYVPRGFAHGYQTIEDRSEVFYQMSEFYSPPHARGVRWDDPAFGIAWPHDRPILAERDRTYPDFRRVGRVAR